MILSLALVSAPALAPAATSTPATSAATAPAAEQPLKPTLQFQTRESYEREIAEPAVLLQSDHVWLFAPKRKEKEAKVIFQRLVAAYDALFAITALHTKYKIVALHLPKGFGGTSECVIEYDYSNLDFDQSDEWKRYKVPHVSGYIEEMAHNFVGTSRAQFGWEMIGWSIGVKATQKVAGNPIFARQIEETRQKQAQTFGRYRAGNFTFPADIEANLCDRIHAHILNQCEQRYGPAFWKDFFAEIRKQQQALADAVHQKGDDNIRNERYRITVDCFDALPKLGFKKLLEQNRISTSVDVKSLHPTDAGWDRKFLPPAR